MTWIAIEIADLDPAVGGGVDEGPAAQINAHMGDVAAAIGEEHQVPGQPLRGGHPGEGVQLVAGPVGDGMTPFNFNTGNYFVNMTFLSFVELSYRCTLLKTRRYDGKRGYFQQKAAW